MNTRERNKLKFIEKAKEKYKDKYDYSKSEYVDMKTKILVICPEHGEFYVTPRAHLAHGSCPNCFNPHKAANEERRIAKMREMARNKEGAYSKEGIAKRRATILERYGAKTWAESEEGRKKLKEQTASPEVRAEMSKRRKDPKTQAKYKATSEKNFGSGHWTQSDFGKKYLKEIFNTDEERKARSERAKSEEVRMKIQNTSLEKYGTPYYWQNDDARLRLKGLLTSPEVIEKTKRTNFERYGSEFWSSSNVGKETLSKVLSSEKVQKKIIDAKRRNGTINSSKHEKIVNKELIKVFGEDDVFAQYKDTDRYPYNCDFYIRSMDLFIELNIYWIHGCEWYDESNSKHQMKLKKWKEKSSKKESYERAIYVWTENDPAKKKTAEENGLNYLVFWNNDLSDFYEWLKQYYKD